MENKEQEKLEGSETTYFILTLSRTVSAYSWGWLRSYVFSYPVFWFWNGLVVSFNHRIPQIDLMTFVYGLFSFWLILRHLSTAFFYGLGEALAWSEIDTIELVKKYNVANKDSQTDPK